MTQKAEIVQELQTIAPQLIGLNSNVFSVPAFYFSECADTILQIIKNEEFIHKMPNKEQSIPPNYFEHLPHIILEKIKQQESEFYIELENLAPTLNTISKYMPYSLPANYFTNFTVSTPINNKAKIVAMHKPIAWVKYAAAACIIGVLAVASFIFVDNKKAKANHLAAINTNVTKSLETLPIQELQKGVEATKAFELSTEVASATTTNFSLPTIEESLDFISTETLETYLNNNENEHIITDGMLNNN